MLPKQRPMRILQVNTSDRDGGAERSAWNLFRAYRARGHDSWLAVGHKRTDDADVLVTSDHSPAGLWNRFCRRLQGQLTPFENKVRGVWRVRAWLDAWEHA